MFNSVTSAFSSLSAKRLVTGLALTVGAAFSASAHVPAPGSEQHDLLKNHEEFIMHMQTPAGGSCCNLNDGRGNVKQQKHDDGSYTVIIEHDLAGNKLATPMPIKIPESALLTVKHAKAVCEKINASKTPEELAKSTCKMPPFNVIWYTDSGHPYCFFPTPKLGR